MHRTKKHKQPHKQRGQRGVKIPHVLVNYARTFMPPAMRTKLTFQKTINFNNTGTAHANIRFAPTFLYDVDPTLGSTSMAGFAELTTIYRYYRMRSCKYVVSAASDDVSPSVLCVCPVNFDPGVNAAGFQAYLSNPISKHTTITSQTPRVIRGKFSLSQFGGVNEELIPDAYSGTSTTSPANNIWLFIGNSIPGTMTNGISADIALTIEADFFEIASPATFFRFEDGKYRLDPHRQQKNADQYAVASRTYPSQVLTRSRSLGSLKI